MRVDSDFKKKFNVLDVAQ